MKTYKQIIGAKDFLTTEDKKFIFNNVIENIPARVEITKTHYKFVMVYGFSTVEYLELPKSEFRIWEMFSSLDSVKIATHALKAIAEGTHTFNEKFFEVQRNVSPKKPVKAGNYSEFMAALSPEEKSTIEKEILRYEQLFDGDGLGLGAFRRFRCMSLIKEDKKGLKNIAFPGSVYASKKIKILRLCFPPVAVLFY